MFNNIKMKLRAVLSGIQTITFITPTQDHTSGGIYAIEQFARLIGKPLRTNLVVLNHPPQQLDNVHVFHAPELCSVELPDADAIIMHADCPHGHQFASLPSTKGDRFIFFQGYGTPESPIVLANLRSGFPVIASATWLADEAIKHGASTRFVPYGLDQSIFHCPPSPRSKTIVMMTHFAPWKGTHDGLDALREVRATLNEVQLVFFGNFDPQLPGASFVSRPTHAEVAGLLANASVFVCASWEEGFGMPGLEAMACGAALVTTDTKGSRDYAIHGKTALVSPPRCSNELAANIISLLTEKDLHARISRAGFDLALKWPNWKNAASAFYGAVVDLH